MASTVLAHGTQEMFIIISTPTHPPPTRIWKKTPQWQKATISRAMHSLVSAVLTSQKVFLKRPLSGPSPILWSLREQTGLISLPPSTFQILEDFCPRSSLFQTSISHSFHCFSFVLVLRVFVLILLTHLLSLIVATLEYVAQDWTKCLWYHQSRAGL